jgi:hypothetical protein
LTSQRLRNAKIDFRAIDNEYFAPQYEGKTATRAVSGKHIRISEPPMLTAAGVPRD